MVKLIQENQTKHYLKVVEVAIEHEQNEWDILRLAAKREIYEEVGLELGCVNITNVTK